MSAAPGREPETRGAAGAREPALRGLPGDEAERPAWQVLEAVPWQGAPLDPDALSAGEFLALL